MKTNTLNQCPRCKCLSLEERESYTICYSCNWQPRDSQEEALRSQSYYYPMCADLEKMLKEVDDVLNDENAKSQPPKSQHLKSQSQGLKKAQKTKEANMAQKLQIHEDKQHVYSHSDGGGRGYEHQHPVKGDLRRIS